MLIDIPQIKCFVNLSFLTDNTETGFAECYIFAATIIPNNYCIFTDLHFTSNNPITYKRQTKVWNTG